MPRHWKKFVQLHNSLMYSQSHRQKNSFFFIKKLQFWDSVDLYGQMCNIFTALITILSVIPIFIESFLVLFIRQHSNAVSILISLSLSRMEGQQDHFWSATELVVQNLQTNWVTVELLGISSGTHPWHENRNCGQNKVPKRISLEKLHASIMSNKCIWSPVSAHDGNDYGEHAFLTVEHTIQWEDISIQELATNFCSLKLWCVWLYTPPVF